MDYLSWNIIDFHGQHTWNIRKNASVACCHFSYPLFFPGYSFKILKLGENVEIIYNIVAINLCVGGLIG